MNLDSGIHRLGQDGYKRPKKTYTDTLQSEEAIKEKLNGFIEIPEDKVDEISPGSFVRYLKWEPDNNREKLVMGGIVLRVLPQYLIIKGKGNGTFSAQRYTFNNKGEYIHSTRFFKMLSNEDKLKGKLLEMKDKANNIIEELEDTIDKQSDEIEQLKELVKKLKKSGK